MEMKENWIEKFNQNTKLAVPLLVHTCKRHGCGALHDSMQQGGTFAWLETHKRHCRIGKNEHKLKGGESHVANLMSFNAPLIDCCKWHNALGISGDCDVSAAIA